MRSPKLSLSNSRTTHSRDRWLQYENETMREILRKIILFLIWIVLIGKISNWFLHYDDYINDILNTTMFIMIGVAYFAGGFIWEKKWVNIAFLISGSFLIIMNFIGDFTGKSIIGIACILTPIIIARFLPLDEDEKQTAED